MKADAKKKIGLALGGGGAKGLAHIGVIKELERAGIEISRIAGTSMGALVGAWYAVTRDIGALEELFLGVSKEDVNSINKLFRKRDGVIFKDASVPAFYESRLKGLTFKDCTIPFSAVTTDTKNGSEVVVGEGSILDAVRASTALPLVFNPVEIGGKTLMDGGFVNPVPADVVRKMGADVVIAVDVSSKWIDFSEEHFSLIHVYSLVAHAMSVIEYQVARRILAEHATIVLHPPVLGYSWLEFGSAKDIIASGAREARTRMNEICAHAEHPLPPKTPFDKFMDFILYAD